MAALAAVVVAVVVVVVVVVGNATTADFSIIVTEVHSAHSQRYNANDAHANRNAPSVTIRNTRKEGGCRERAVMNAK